MSEPRTETIVLIKALEILSRGIESADGVANAAIAEAAQRLQELSDDLDQHKTTMAQLKKALEEHFGSHFGTKN